MQFHAVENRENLAVIAVPEPRLETLGGMTTNRTGAPLRARVFAKNPMRSFTKDV